MSRRLLNIGSFFTALWILILTVVAPPGLVVCAGDDGHVALEQVHKQGHHGPSSHDAAGIAHTHQGDCSDTPVLTFYGRVRTSSRQSAFENIALAGIDYFINPGLADTIRLAAKNPAGSALPINYSIELSTVILLC